MKKLNYLTRNKAALLIGCSALFFACSNDDTDDVFAPEIEMTVQDSEVQLTMGETLSFEAINTSSSEVTSTWTLGDSIVSTESTYDFTPITSGDFDLHYHALNTGGEFTFDYEISVEAFIRPSTPSSSAYVSELIEYLPAPGQFINTSLGNLEGAEKVVGGKSLVSLGAWGGSITLGFDHTILNSEDEKDLIIYANAMPTFSEPGIVWVMQDENANGIADDTWYEIKGAAHDLEGSMRDYNVTYFRPETDASDVVWEDSEGNSGVVETNIYHTQAYYPEWITEDSYTITGTILTDENIDMSNPSFITSAPYDYGYADNTVGGDQIDIADAIDAEGNSVNLTGVDFIKIQTGVQANMGWLGELSTEVTGVADLSLLN